MPIHLENETSLVEEARAGSATAFSTLVHQYSKNVYRVALNITGNQEDAEDVTQEAFLKALANLARFQGESRFYTWLTRITVNEALMKLRKRKSDRTVSLDEPIEGDEKSFMPRDIEDWGDNPEQRFAKVELQGILSQAIEQLDPPYRIVFALRDIENMSTEETAETLGMSIPAVKSRLLRARLKLREHLNPYFKRGPGDL
jgi:RNA polymerase sigma-70 factor (ECF subfamily)